jgi:hypothetical protein
VSQRACPALPLSINRTNPERLFGIFLACKPDVFASAGYLFDSICGALQFFLVWHASFGVIFHDYSATSDSFVTLGHATAELGFLDRSWMLKTEFS